MQDSLLDRLAQIFTALIWTAFTLAPFIVVICLFLALLILNGQ